MTVKEMLRRIDSAELTEWMAFYNMEADEAEAARESKTK